jgi:hypothetical protein
MAQSGYTPISLYYSTTPGAKPLAANLVNGELAVNITDKLLYIKNSAGSVVQISGGATGGGGDQVFVQNQQVVTTSYTLSTGYNAESVGPITINGGVTVTVPAGQRWVVL